MSHGRKLAMFLMIAAYPPLARAATLDVEVTGIDDDRGLVRVAVCTRETFTTTHCPFAGAMPARPGVIVNIEGIPPGRYAVQAFHDDDGSGRLRRGLFGLPEESIGFSRDAPLRLGPPRFDDAVIDITDPKTTARLRLRRVGG